MANEIYCNNNNNSKEHVTILMYLSIFESSSRKDSIYVTVCFSGRSVTFTLNKRMYYYCTSRPNYLKTNFVAFVAFHKCTFAMPNTECTKYLNISVI